MRKCFVILAKDYRYAGAVPLKIETHGGDDVGIFALGKTQNAYTQKSHICICILLVFCF